MPAAMASTAKAVVTVAETLTSSNGKSPVRINHTPSKIIPMFRPAKLSVTAIGFSFEERTSIKLSAVFLTWILSELIKARLVVCGFKK